MIKIESSGITFAMELKDKTVLLSFVFLVDLSVSSPVETFISELVKLDGVTKNIEKPYLCRKKVVLKLDPLQTAARQIKQNLVNLGLWNQNTKKFTEQDISLKKLKEYCAVAPADIAVFRSSLKQSSGSGLSESSESCKISVKSKKFFAGTPKKKPNENKSKPDTGIVNCKKKCCRIL